MRLFFCVLFSILSLSCFTDAWSQETEWTFPLEGSPLSPTLYPSAAGPTGLVAVAGSKAVLIAGDGKAVWEHSFDIPVAQPAAVADLDGNAASEVVVVLGDASVACLGKGGNLIWQRSVKESVHALGIPVAADVHPGTGLEIIVPRMDGWVYCLDAGGNVIWRFYGDRFRASTVSAGDADGDGVPEIVFGTDNGHVYCLDGFGGVKWRHDGDSPLGRTGPVLANLDKDGIPEVLVTRSNTGRYLHLTALDGRTGVMKWRSEMRMQSYVGIAVADVDGDGREETFRGDKGNWLYCTDAEGREKWQIELAGRGIFWAPAVGDLDGDGKAELIVPVRDNDPVTGANYWMVSGDGGEKTPIKLGSGGSATPVLGDIDGDGRLEAVFASSGPNQLHCLGWGGKADGVLWPQLRGDSALTGARLNTQASPLKKAFHPAKHGMAWEREPLFIGQNMLSFRGNGEMDGAEWVECRLDYAVGLDETVVAIPEIEGKILRVPLCLSTAGQARIHVLVRDEGGKVLAVAVVSAKIAAHDAMALRKLQKTVEGILPAGLAAGADISGLKERMRRLESLAPSVDAPERAEAFLEMLEATKSLTAMLGTAWGDNKTPMLGVWQDGNPWDAFSPLEAPPAGNPGLRIMAAQGEFEDGVLNITNLTGRPLDVRCVFSKPKLAGGQPGPEPALAERFTLRRAVAVPDHFGKPVLDALPELDLSRSLHIAPMETVQLWLVADTHGLGAGTHETVLYLGVLESPATFVEVPVRLDVLPFSPTEGVYAQMNWAGTALASCSDQQLADMLDHGITVDYGPHLPALQLNAEGAPASPADWSKFDAALDRLPPWFQMLFPAPPSVKWPEGVAPEKGSALEEQGFAVAVRELARHLAEKGVGYDRWALYPFDEPWLTGFTVIPELRRFCERVRAADPRVRLYADPAGLVRVEHLEPFKDLIDIWQPEINILRRDPELVAWFQKNARVFWGYEATDPGKNLDPLAYYRVYAWQAWHFGLDGAGFWCYKYHDAWWPLETTDWSVVYQTGNQVVPSRRWEACRDGQEDYRLLHLLRGEIGKAREDGRTEKADAAEKLMNGALSSVLSERVLKTDEISRQCRPFALEPELFDQARRNLFTALELLNN